MVLKRIPTLRKDHARASGGDLVAGPDGADRGAGLPAVKGDTKRPAVRPVNFAAGEADGEADGEKKLPAKSPAHHGPSLHWWAAGGAEAEENQKEKDMHPVAEGTTARAVFDFVSRLELQLILCGAALRSAGSRIVV